jgi:hypothetical protein
MRRVAHAEPAGSSPNDSETAEQNTTFRFWPVAILILSSINVLR